MEDQQDCPETDCVWRERYQKLSQKFDTQSEVNFYFKFNRLSPINLKCLLNKLLQLH